MWPFKRAHRPLREGHVGRIELGVVREEPDAGVRVENQVAPAPRQADLWFECPAIGALIDEPAGIVLTGGSNNSNTRANEQLLMPLGKLRRLHGRTAQQVDGE